MATVHSNAAAIGVGDVVVRLGLDVKTSQEVTPAAGATSTALTAFSDVPTLRGIAYDLDRVAASTSNDPDGARADWANRRVNEIDANGNRMDKPKIIGLVFTGTRRVIQGVEDLGIAAFINLPGIGNVEVQPLFVAVSGLKYVVENADGTLIGERAFYGTVYRPRGDGPCKFVQVEFADPKLIERWNGLVDLGQASGTIHGQWPKIEHMNLGLGRLRRILHAPLYRTERTYTDKFRGRERKRTDVIIGSWCGKTMQMYEKSQAVPAELIEQNKAAWLKGENPPNLFEFQMNERYGSIELVLLGRAGETRPSVVTIETGADMFDPFDILGVSMERFDPDKAKRQLKAWMTLPVDNHPLRLKAFEIGRIVEGMSRAAQRPQLVELGREAVTRATELWQDAVGGAWDKLKRDFCDLPTLEACLASGEFKEVRERLNNDDAAAAWLSSRLSDLYNHHNLAHRELRRRLLDEIQQRERKAAKENEAPVVEANPSAS